MKRALLIAGGTVGGLGAVLSVTPPQLSSNGLATIAGASAATSLSSNSQTQSSAATTQSNPAPATTSASPKSKSAKKNHSGAKNNASTNNNASSNSNSTSTNSSSAGTSNSSSTSNNLNSGNSTASTQTTTESKSSVSGSFTGDTINVGYGLVQVKITVSNGRITDATALQSPNGRSQRFSDYALPNLREQTLQAQSANIQGVSGASYTSYGWYKSLISALQKAGMKTGV